MRSVKHTLNWIIENFIKKPAVERHRMLSSLEAKRIMYRANYIILEAVFVWLPVWEAPSSSDSHLVLGCRYLNAPGRLVGLRRSAVIVNS